MLGWTGVDDVVVASLKWTSKGLGDVPAAARHCTVSRVTRNVERDVPWQFLGLSRVQRRPSRAHYARKAQLHTTFTW